MCRRFESCRGHHDRSPKLLPVHCVLARTRDRWLALLDGPLDELLTALTADTVASRELRQNSPFVGVLTEEERTAILQGMPSPARDVT